MYNSISRLDYKMVQQLTEIALNTRNKGFNYYRNDLIVTHKMCPKTPLFNSSWGECQGNF